MALNLNLIKLLCGSIYIQNSLILSDIFKIKKNQKKLCKDSTVNHCRVICYTISEAIKKLEYFIHMHFTYSKNHQFIHKKIIKYIACYHSCLNSNLIYI